jgi:hypothetical protein
MAYEVFDYKATRLGSPALTITTDGRLALNGDAGDLLRSVGAKFAHLLWNAEARKIALRPLTKRDSRSYRLTVPRAHKRGMSVSAATFLRYIGGHPPPAQPWRSNGMRKRNSWRQCCLRTGVRAGYRRQRLACRQRHTALLADGGRENKEVVEFLRKGRSQFKLCG